MCATGATAGGQAVEEAIHVVGGAGVLGRLVSTLTRQAAKAGDSSVLRIDNKYYRAAVPIRTYERLSDVPECISGALVLVLMAERGRGTGDVADSTGASDAFDEFAAWWAARERERDEVEVPLILAWGVGSDERGEEREGGTMRGVFEWCVEQGFELVYCPDEDGEAGRGTEVATRETSGVQRVREALQHCRWSMAEMKVVPARTGVGSDQVLCADDDEPNWKRMNDDVLGAFSRLAACGSDSDDDAEETFAALATMLRRR